VTKVRLVARAKAHAARLLDADASSLLPQDELTNLQRYLLRADLALLAASPRRLISATRKIQGAKSRRRSVARELATACQWVRGQIAGHFRGHAWASLRQAFAAGMPIAPEKSALIAAAQLIVRSYHSSARYASQAKVRPQSIARIQRLLAALSVDEMPALRQAQRDIQDERDAAAARILATQPGAP